MAKYRRAPVPEAVALAYRDGSNAPRVVAKGRGILAETIIEKAREAGVFVHASPELTSLLMQVDLDKQIPTELYRAVAELLAFIHFLENGVEAKAPVFIPPAVNPDDAAANEG
ncbi:EscU/YscU/HrcU family type III secretion system export apparatus switch protein [Chitinimonas sp. BJB300]|uniref:EscU/YscU/HrcU family type III secretion system export apparatus switch protein n=1 Tax=Chitinimonas sp. BJB300 TaxID=1559339 RepID=UPI000C0F30D6|nr:EscU/YscU/HrcU family type III secretion system export apparatus switch protein [Chitinimonas sp. BJB300]PHV12471.1 hypothetical protein CSQ89_05415 [Chitinimonas sp. BJB300]TSJ89140.1 hypothetical protein FG002_009740 [Chitinimonas sp. BJB300]